MCFGRIITYVGEQYSPVRASRVTAIFVTFDVIVGRHSSILAPSGARLLTSLAPTVLRRPRRWWIALLE